MSTVDPQVGPRHEAASVAQQEDGGAAVVLGPAERAEHVVLRPFDLALRELVEQFLHHLRHDVSRRYRVHADPVAAPLHREVAPQLDHGRFGRVVDPAGEG